MIILQSFILLFSFVALGIAEDYYELLGVDKAADNRDIRRAFKKLALKMHPDKNTNDKDAHEKFIKINKAYEVLKDEEARKKYDLYGEEGLKDDFGTSWQGSYQSWNFYYESFGIYDDDPEIITLSRSDFEQSVVDSPDTWFINFYSPQCSHCHELAPAWRQMARELEGIIHIGAVNCEEDWILCRQQNIPHYPSLIIYPEKADYRGGMDADSLIAHVLKRLPSKVFALKSKNLQELISNHEYQRPWLISVCKSRDECIFDDVLHKLSIVLDGLVNVAKADIKNNKKICESINCDALLTYYGNSDQPLKSQKFHEIDEREVKSILNEVLKLLPSIEQLTDVRFQDIIEELKSPTSDPWLIEFVQASDPDASSDRELKRLQAVLPGVEFGQIGCTNYGDICSEWSVRKFPTFILFKPGGVFEFHHGRFTAHDIATFVRQSLSSRVETLSPKDFPSVVSSGEPWFIDFYAPWCPPCMQLLPEWRKASRTVGHLVKFGTVDCTMHHDLCTQYNIRSYPTTILYNQSFPHQFHGSHNQKQLEEFVRDTLNPPVVALTPETFEHLVNRKSEEDLWAIDFFAPWCGPCQQLAPQWRKLAKMMKQNENIHIGHVDCTMHSDLCTQHGVNSYPTIRLYPQGKRGASKFHYYNGWNRDAGSFQAWIYSYLPSKVEVLGDLEFSELLKDKEPWLVDFYAPWCGHCQVFAPEFEKVAQTLDGKVKSGKVNCQELPYLCQEAGVHAYPTVLFYAGRKKHVKQGPVGEEIHNLNYKSITSFIENRLHIKLKRPKHDEL